MCNENTRTTAVPPLLGDLIERVRLFPLNGKLPKVINDDYGIKLQTVDDIYKMPRLSTRGYLIEAFDSLPEELNEHIWGRGRVPQIMVDEEIEKLCPDLSLTEINRILPRYFADEKFSSLNPDILPLIKQTEEAAIRYLEFKELWEQFKVLTMIVNGILAQKQDMPSNRKKGNYRQRGWVDTALNIELPISPQYKFEKDGTLSIIFDEFTQAINGVEVARVRRCKWCHRVFWAGRKDQICCPPEEVKDEDGRAKARPSKCKNSYNVSKIERPVKLRERKIKEWSEIFVDEEWMIHEPTPFIPNDPGAADGVQILEKRTRLTVTKLEFDSGQKDLPFRFSVKIKNGKTGFIVFKCDARTPERIKKTFGVEW